MEKNKKNATINFNIELDQNHVPESIIWSATDSDSKHNQAKAIMISIWDGQEKKSLKIDLWTKDMMAEEMNFFTFQILDSLAESYKKSVGDEKVYKEIKGCAKKMGKISKVLK